MQLFYSLRACLGQWAHGVLIGLLPLAAQPWTSIGSPVSFEAEGTIVYRYYRHHRVLTNEFFFSYEDGKYYVQLAEPSGGASGMPVIEYTFDSKDSYMGCYFNTNLVGSQLHKLQKGRFVPTQSQRPVRVGAPMMAVISSGPRPPVEQLGLTLLWLAFASQDYFPRQSDPREAPLFFLGWYYQAFDLKLLTVWRTNSALPGCLESLSQFHEGKRFGENNHRLIATPLPPSLDRGYTNCSFFTTQWQTSNGLALPRHFGLVSLGPGDIGSVSLETNVLCEGSASLFRPARHDIQSPTQFLAQTRIVEEREKIIGRRSQVVYTATNGQILDAEAIRKVPTYNDSGYSRKSSALARVLVYFVFAVIAVGPVFLLLRKGNAGEKRIGQPR